MAKQIIQPTRKVDRLNQADFDIFKQGSVNVNFFTDWYMRSPSSGTRFSRHSDSDNPKLDAIWLMLIEAWTKEGKPGDGWTHQGVPYRILVDENEDPIFWVHHGWLWQDWQKDCFHAPQPEQTIIGGFGCGKTAYIAMSLAVLAATIPNFRGYAVAPQMLQAMEVYRYISTACADTPWWNRWVWRNPMKPIPLFEIKNSYVGTSTIEILSIEHDPEKVRTLEGDVIFLDQAEKIDDLDGLIRDLGSRLRGAVHGRSRLGRLCLIANAGDNPQLWYRYDMGELEPNIYLSKNPKSSDNPAISKKDLESLYRRVGGTKQDAEQWMNGQRPMGRGEHFPPDMVRACTNVGLDNVMDAWLKQKDDEITEWETVKETINYDMSPLDSEAQQYHRLTTHRVGVYRWEMPPDHRAKRQYIVIADPGQGNPPDRNSACIMAWDITDFPSKPATMRAFNWVFCNGSYWPFLQEYERYVKLYHAQGRNAFDSTGTQKGFDELVFATMELHAQGMDMAQNGKYLALNSLKFFMGKYLMQFPYISHLVNQLTNYRLPDTKIAQDLVMTMAMSAAYMRRFYYEDIPDDETLARTRATTRTVNRYERDSIDRNSRSGQPVIRTDRRGIKI
jgi:hypothetical protein